jgi:hypothetical protein
MTDSIAQRLPRLLVMIEDFGGIHDQNDPFRFAKHKTQQAAWTALDGGMRAAADILEAGEAFIRAAHKPPAE